MATIGPRLRSGMPSVGACRPKVSKLASNERLREHVQDKLSGPGTVEPGADRAAAEARLPR